MFPISQRAVPCSCASLNIDGARMTSGNDMKALFEARGAADVTRLIDEYPLAWVVSAAGSGFAATPLPLLAEHDSSGALTSLLGHFAVSNPHVAQLRDSPWATIL